MGGPPIDDDLLDATAELLDQHGLAGLTVSAVAERAGVSRVTLHRRGIGTEELVVGVLRRASDDLRAALWPVITGPGEAAVRLEAALTVLCEVAERHAGVLSALFRSPVRPLPDAPGRTTSFEFIEPFERLLVDGNVDSSLQSEEPLADATLLANTVTWSYLHMRHAHRWSAARTSRKVIALGLAHLLPAGSADRGRPSR